VILEDQKIQLANWFNLFRAAVIFLFITFLALTMTMGYRQTQAYLHPPRGVAFNLLRTGWRSAGRNRNAQ
jgi:hypothetical protein